MVTLRIIALGVADGFGDVGKEVFAVAAGHLQLYGEELFLFQVPLYRYQTFGVCRELGDIRTVGPMDRQPPAPGDLSR